MSDVHTAFDSFVDALADGDGYYLECSNGHACLPPRNLCPDCGDSVLKRRSLPERGEIASHTTIRVPGPEFEADAPYVLAVVSLGSISLTGRVENVDPDGDEVAVGLPVSVAVRETDDDRLIVFTPQ
ncbi:Zn-ribbon domain-containing OB-fold protein [Natrialbaceae archaeon GCM10025810]|uniref:Zn-ribbon domain-containing OB-fold protein n=1 Tax=Halovalidus salilacus TaxID=3075124 RepID=UPI00360C2BA0